MAEENKSYGLAWFLAGLGVGALVGILYAPKERQKCEGHRFGST